MRRPQTPSFTKSPSLCGGKCFLGAVSHSRICRRRLLATVFRTKSRFIASPGLTLCPQGPSRVPPICKCQYAENTIHRQLGNFISTMADTSGTSSMAHFASRYAFSNGVAFKNRALLAPMTNLQSDEDGTLSDLELAWLESRAQGGYAALITACSHVQERGKSYTGQLGCF